MWFTEAGHHSHSLERCCFATPKVDADHMDCLTAPNGAVPELVSLVLEERRVDLGARGQDVAIVRGVEARSAPLSSDFRTWRASLKAKT